MELHVSLRLLGAVYGEGQGPDQFHQQLKLSCRSLHLPQGHPDTLYSCPRGGHSRNCRALCRATLHWLSPSHGRSSCSLCITAGVEGHKGSLVASRILIPDFSGSVGGLRLKGPDPGTLFLLPVSDSHLLRTSAKTPGCSEKNCTLLAWLSAARVWEMSSCGKKAPVKPRGMWNLGSSQI